MDLKKIEQMIKAFGAETEQATEQPRVEESEQIVKKSAFAPRPHQNRPKSFHKKSI